MASVGSIVGGAFALFRQRPGAIAIWAITFIVGLIALSFLFGGAIFASMVGADPTEMANPAAVMGRMLGSLLLFYLAIFFLMVILMNAVFRSILRPEDRSFASLRVGGDELRMFGLIIVFAIAFIVIYFIFALILGLILSALGFAAGGDPRAAMVLGLVLGLATLCAYIWFYVRISLLFPLSFHRRSFIELDGAWRLSRGKFWTLFASYLVVWVLTIVLFLLVFWLIAGGATMSAMFSGASGPEQTLAIQEAMAQRGTPSVVTIILSFLLYIVAMIVSIVLGPAIIASATRELLIESGESLEGDIERTAEIFE